MILFLLIDYSFDRPTPVIFTILIHQIYFGWSTPLHASIFKEIAIWSNLLGDYPYTEGRRLGHS